MTLAIAALSGCDREPASPVAGAPEAPDTAAPAAGEEASATESEPYRYVLLAQSPKPETVGFARVIVAQGARCPTLVATSGPDRATLLMSRRQRPALGSFPVDVCEAAIEPALFGATLSIEQGGQSWSLPSVDVDPTRIIALGDTGCYSDACATGSPAQPFQSLATAAAADPDGWDLLLHMGDYNYRGTPGGFYDAGDGKRASDNCDQATDSGFKSMNLGSAPDNWQNWEDDFFEPAGELLWAAPWIFTRGNHELCSRAGPGWFYFLDPSSRLPAGGGSQRDCPMPDASDQNPFDWVVLPPPYLVELGSLNVAVIDSANACDAFATPAMAQFTGSYQSQMRTLASLTAGKGTTWIMTHRPIWGVNPYEADKSTSCAAQNEYSCWNQTLQYAIGSAGGLNGVFPPEISLSLAGHMHKFQSLTFTAPQGQPPRVPQVITGDGGVSLDTRAPCDQFATTIDGYAAAGRATGGTMTTDQGAGVAGFGFLEIEYSPGGTWSGTLEDPATGATIATCGTTELAGGSVCEFKVKFTAGCDGS